MLDTDTIAALAYQLKQTRATRTPLRHFSARQFPGMTIDDGYAIQRAWVALELAEGRRIKRPQDRAHLARDAAVQPDRPSPTTRR